MNIVHSPQGDIIIHPATGFVKDGSDSIKQFNLHEYRGHYGKTDSEYDILDLGYWKFSGEYEKPNDEFRNKAKEEGRKMEDVDIEVGVELVVDVDNIERVNEILVSKNREVLSIQTTETNYLVRYSGVGVLPDVVNLGVDVIFEFDDGVTLEDIKTLARIITL